MGNLMGALGRIAAVAVWVLFAYGTVVVLTSFEELDPGPGGELTPNRSALALEFIRNEEWAERIVRSLNADSSRVRDSEESGSIQELSPKEKVEEALERDSTFFIPLYFATIGIAVWWGRSQVRSRRVAAWGGPVLAMLSLAVILDLLENYALTRVLSGDFSPWTLIAPVAAFPKFLLIGVAVIYALLTAGNAVLRSAGSMVRLVRRRYWMKEGKREEDIFSHDRVPPWRTIDWEPHDGKIGICCSGGGIRSAAYNLGALQVLQEAGILVKARFLSAVSGGAYIAAAYTLMQEETADKDAFEDRPPWSRGSPEETYLRNRSSYIAPGLWGRLRLVARLLIGVLINLLFFWLLLYLASRTLGWLLRSDFFYPGLLEKPPTIEIPSYFGAAVLAPALLGMACALFAMLRRFGSDIWYKTSVRFASFFLIVSLSLLTLLVLLPLAVHYVPLAFAELFEFLGTKRELKEGETYNLVWLLQILGITALVGGALRGFLKQSSRLAMLVAVLVAPLVAAITFITMLDDATEKGPAGSFNVFRTDLGSERGWLIGLGILFAFMYWASDQTTWSMHPFYKRRLCSAFALRRSSGQAIPLDYDELQRLSKYDRDPGTWPELVVCAAANVAEEEHIAPPKRNSVSFTFSTKEVGGREVGWIKTPVMEEAMDGRKEDITLPAAVAISGAALSPAMGKMTKGAVSPLLALVNARLGVWLPHPEWVMRGATSRRKWPHRPRVIYLLKEIFGAYRREDTFLYVSDGGHWENLGLVELLRRGCTHIFCFDASGGDVDTFYTLGEAVAIARTELEVEIDIDPEPMRNSGSEPAEKNESENEETEKEVAGQEKEKPKEGWIPQDHVVGSFKYPGENGKEGIIVFARAGVTKDAPWDIKSFAEKDESFPHHSTADQFFTDEKFESYRKLGEHTARKAVNSWKKKLREDQSWLERFLEALD